MNNHIENTLLATQMYDEDWNPIDTPPLVEEFLQKIAKDIHHDIYDLRFFEVDGRLFAAVSLNVNWQDPCELYEYDAKTKEMRYLYSWQCTKVLGIALPK